MKIITLKLMFEIPDEALETDEFKDFMKSSNRKELINECPDSIGQFKVKNKRAKILIRDK